MQHVKIGRLHPNVHHGKKIAVLSTVFLKATKERKNLMFLYNKIAESQAPKVQTLKGQRYVKLA